MTTEDEQNAADQRNAYAEGYKAREKWTARCSENPHHPGEAAELYDAWKRGWMDRHAGKRRER